MTPKFDLVLQNLRGNIATTGFNLPAPFPGTFSWTGAQLVFTPTGGVASPVLDTAYAGQVIFYADGTTSALLLQASSTLGVMAGAGTTRVPGVPLPLACKLSL